MSRHNYDLYNNSQMGRALDTWMPNRRRFGFYAEPTLTGFTHHGIGSTYVSAQHISPTSTAQVTQLTDKSTAVTLNSFAGLITTVNTNIAAGAEATFTVNNSLVQAGDTVTVCIVSGATASGYSINVDAVADGSFRIVMTNLTAGGLTDILVIKFQVHAPLFRPVEGVGTMTVAQGDAAGGAAVTIITGSAGSGDSCKLLTATAITRRQWDPWIRFRFVTGTSAQWTDARIWLGAFSADPSAVAGADLGTGGALSGAAFGWDDGVDAGVIASTGAGTAYFRCETADASGETTTVTSVPIIASCAYTAEIRFNSALGRVEFYLANNGLNNAARVESPLQLVASHSSTLPAAATPLLVGGTVTTLTNAAKRLILASVEGSQN